LPLDFSGRRNLAGAEIGPRHFHVRRDGVHLIQRAVPEGVEIGRTRIDPLVRPAFFKRKIER
jgi:hypothetical protein